ncbi:DNA polymerase III subunit gamma/tau [Rubrivirga sp. IMCC45206]|uniref:DNA polymerase III subunit gamma/tau n=1 Tax=Rubrivirga sp. IMCC45206 TaxID=3391614 RepID=UPI00398FC1EF
MADTPPDQAPRFTVTARKYRPQTFDDLVAQEHVAETLRNAITRKRLAHAYLFSGPRGVGKTTAARILAKAVNCQTPLAERERAEPCRTCDSCVAFEEHRSLNIIEIDAASNNKVEDIRELRDTVRVPPQGANKKVYILDEVHMLSASAFNALLKTLEEPPEYALFIFATTEPHKVLPTILSRTQRFDFRRISVPEIVDRLRAISTAEGITADEESLVLIARKADGALRDALSLFDQAVSLCGQNLEIGPLRTALGVVDSDVYFEATSRARTGDRAGLLSLVDHVVRSGHDLNEFVLGLAEHFRNLLVARATQSGDLIEGTEATRERYLDAAAPLAEADVLHLLMLAEAAAHDLRESRHPRLTLELALIKMASLESAADLRHLLGRLSALEGAARAGTLPAPSGAPSPAAPAASAPTARAGDTPPAGGPPTSAPTPSPAPASSASDRSTAAPTPSAPPAPSAPTPPPPAAAPRPALPPPAALTPAAPAIAPRASAPTPAASAPDTPAPSPATEPPELAVAPTPAPEPEARREPAAEPAIRPGQTSETPASYAADDDGPPPHTDDDMGGLAEDFDPVPPPRPAPALRTPTPSPPPRRVSPTNPFGAPALQRASGDGHDAEASLTESTAASIAATDALGPALATVTDAWPRFVAAVRKEVGVRVASIVRTGAPFRVRRGAVEVGMEDAFGVTVATENDEALSAVLATVLGAPAPPLRWVESPRDTVETARPDDPFETLKQMRKDHPVVRALFETFGAEIVWN